MSRIQLTDNLMDIMVKMADGNPGAVMALTDLYEKSAKIDPQSALGGLGSILSLDTHGIYGTDIYVLYSDKCDKDTRKMCLLLRSVQLGLFPESKLKQMASDQMRKVNLTDEEWTEIDKNVCGQLQEFQRPPQPDQNKEV